MNRFRDVPPFGPPIPEDATFPKSKAFAEFLYAKGETRIPSTRPALLLRRPSWGLGTRVKLAGSCRNCSAPASDRTVDNSAARE